MACKALAPDEVTFNSLASAFEKGARWAEAIALLREAGFRLEKGLNLKPNEHFRAWNGAVHSVLAGRKPLHHGLQRAAGLIFGVEPSFRRR